MVKLFFNYNCNMMYTKTIAGRQVFSDCRTIKLEKGGWISNPSEEQIFAEGWAPYTPPVIPDIHPAEQSIISAVQKMLANDAADLSDEDALAVAAIFPAWADKAEVTAGERVWYDGKLYRVVQSHATQPDWTPDKTPALFTEVSLAEWPEWVQPTGAHDAYNKGDKVTHGGKHYISDIDANVWEPGVAGWSEA